MAKKKVEDMDIVEFSRWGALLKAIDIIEENCEALGKPFEELDLKPIALKHYINSLANNIQQTLEDERDQIEQHTTKKMYNDKLMGSLYSTCQKHGVLQDSSI